MTVHFAPIDLQFKVTLAPTRVFDATLRQLRAQMIRKVMEEMEGDDKIIGVIAAKGIELAQRPTKYWTNRVYFSADVTKGTFHGMMPLFRIRFIVGGPGARFYNYVNYGTPPHVIKPRRAKALIIRGYIPRTRPVYSEFGYGRDKPVIMVRKFPLRSVWEKRTVYHYEALRGYKGKYYPRAWLRRKGIERRHFVFAKRALQHINRRLFNITLAKVLEHTLAAELNKLGIRLRDHYGAKVVIRSYFERGKLTFTKWTEL